MMGFGMGFGVLWMIIVFFVLALIIGLAIWLLASLFPRIGAGGVGATGGRGRETPLDILQRRYAAGEISKTEFAEMRDEILKG